MTIEQARAINSALCNCSLWPIFQEDHVRPNFTLLQETTLADCLQAVRMIESDNETRTDGRRATVAADRLIAAAYALANYQPQEEAIAAGPYGLRGCARVLAIVQQEYSIEESEG